VIARTWHGTVRAEDAAAYLSYLNGTGVADLQATEGSRGVYILRRVDGERAEFLMISLWRDLEDIRAFAGDDVERARYYPEDEAFLFELDPGVAHYEVVVRPGMTDGVGKRGGGSDAE
jgi:heme-degrading monooxygenase HmoA